MRIAVLKLLKKVFLVACFSFPSSLFAETSSEYYEKALEAYNQNDFAATYILLKNSLQQNDDNLPAKILMGKILMINSYMDESEAVLEEALSLGGDPSLIVDTLGKVWLYTQQNEKIVNSKFKNLTKQAETDWQIIVATAHLNLKDLSSARIGYEKALKNNPTNIRALNALTLLELHQDNFEKSKTYLDKSLFLEPENTATLRLLGDFHLRQKHVKEAIAAYQQSFTLDPLDPITKRALVTAYLQDQDINAARKLLENILQQTPGDPTGLLLKAWILAKDQMSDEAARELESLSAKLAGLTGEALQERPALLYVSALSAYALQNYQQAKSFFIQYLTLVPDNAEAVALLAQTYVKLNEPKRALEAVQRHESELMDTIENAILIAELYLASEKSFKAVEITRKLQELYPEDPRVELLEIKTLMSRGKHQDALNKLNASQHGNTSVRFIIARTQLLMAMGNLDEANKIADKLLELSPDNIDFLNLKAVIFIRQVQYTDAETYLDKALAINPEHFSARFNKANILSARGEHKKAIEIATQLNIVQPDTVNVLTLLARSQYNAGNLEAAEESLERVLQKDIDNLFAMELLANIHTRQGEPEKAIRQLTNAIKTEPEKARYQMQRAELYLTLKQNERVTRELAKIKLLVKDDPKGLVDLSKIQLKANDIEGAKQSIAAALQMQPDQQLLAIEYVRTHLLTGDLNNAREMLNKWLAVKPNEPQLLVLSGDVYVADENANAAAKDYLKVLDIAGSYRPAAAKLFQLASKGTAQDAFENKVIELLNNAPDDYFSRNLLADFYINQGRLDKALIEYEKLIKIEELPNKAFILNNMANIYIGIDLNKAQQLIDQAIQGGADVAALYDTQGWILSLKGQYEEALTVLRKAFAMDSDDPSNQYHLAYTLHKLNRIPQAKSSLERALESSRPFSERTDAEALLLKL